MKTDSETETANERESQGQIKKENQPVDTRTA